VNGRPFVGVFAIAGTPSGDADPLLDPVTLVETTGCGSTRGVSHCCMSLELPTATMAAAATTATIATSAHRLSERGEACALVLAAGQDVSVESSPDAAERTPGRERSFSSLISTARLPTMPTVLSGASKGTVSASLTLGAGAGAFFVFVIASHMVEGTCYAPQLKCDAPCRPSGQAE